jgi:hypothetical protein
MWMANHHHENITPEELGGLFNTAYMKIAGTDKAANGARNTAIFFAKPACFHRKRYSSG